MRFISASEMPGPRGFFSFPVNSATAFGSTFTPGGGAAWYGFFNSAVICSDKKKTRRMDDKHE
jgi:hypothetical protein